MNRVLLAALLLVLTGCLAADNGGSGTPYEPGDPAYGNSGQALVGNSGLSLWIGIDDPAVAAAVEENLKEGTLWWIGGTVVPDSSRPLDFYFDPETVITAEVTAEGIQTTLAAISANPSFYAPGGGGGFTTWVVAGKILDFTEG